MSQIARIMSFSWMDDNIEGKKKEFIPQRHVSGSKSFRKNGDSGSHKTAGPVEVTQ